MIHHSQYPVIVLIIVAILVHPQCGSDSPTKPQPPVPARITITPDSLTMTATGQAKHLTASVYDADNRIIRDAIVTWTSSDPNLATVTERGVITAQNTGRVVIFATSGNAKSSVGASISTSNSDRENLIALYNATNGPNWTNKTNWLSDAPLDEWHGIETNEAGRVVEIRLTQNNLQGTIPIELDQLDMLETLSFFVNRLSGTIPKELGSLENLGSLWLSENDLSGTIPPELGKLRNLWQLGLAGNRLTGSIPLEFSQLANITTLFLGQNAGLCVPENTQLNAWFDEIQDKDEIPRCKVIDIEALAGFYHATGGQDWTNKKNWLSDAPLSDWYGVTTDIEGRVAELNLADNNLIGLLPHEVADLTNLRVLNVAFNSNLAGSLPTRLSELDLEHLVLNGTNLCALEDAGFQSWLATVTEETLNTCEDLDTVALIALVGLYNSAGGSNWEHNTNWLRQAPLGAWHGVTTDANGKVTELDLSNNSLNGSLPAALSSLSDLKVLNVSENPGLTGPLPQSFKSFNLETLSLDGTGLCVPADSSFQLWLQGIPEVSGQTDCSSVNPDREVLVTLYNKTNGSNWTKNSNWLSTEPLDNWHGVTTDGSGRVTELILQSNNLLGTVPGELGQLNELQILRLGFNELSGSIPPELGNLVNLHTLEIPFCWLSGTIPPELGRLTRLETLSLGGNGSTLTGPLPRELGLLSNLKTIWLHDNGFTGHIPLELGQINRLEVIDLRWNNLTGRIPRELGELSQLRELRLVSNEISGPLPLELGRLTNLVQLELSRNQISGTLPPELGQLPNLRVLDLANNSLQSPIPSELGQLSALRELVLAGNSEMSGPLPREITKLSLETLMLGDTGICTPRDIGFQAWLRSVQYSRVGLCSIPIRATAYLTQATQSLDYPVPLVAGEDAFLRVFVQSDDGMDITMPPVRATFYQNGNTVYTVDISGEEFNVPDVLDENELSGSANVTVPGSVVMPGLEAVIEIDPDETLEPANGISGRIPDSGRMSVDVRQMPTLDLTLVPYLWSDGPELAVLSVVDGLTPESELMRPTRDLLPVGDFRLTVHAPVWTSVDPISDNVITMGPELEAIYAIEGGRGYYMGIFRAQGPSGLLGIAAGIPSYLSFSVLDPNVIAHELGHNLNLYHAPCGGAAGPDPYFPYDDGSVGTSGYNFLSGNLVSPGTWDLMSYCEPQWISDYSFTRALNHRMAEGAKVLPAPAVAVKGLLLWGGLDHEGDIFLEPAFVVDAPPSLPSENGPYTITGEREDGSVLFTMSFDISEYADAEGGSFAFILPVRANWAGSLERMTISGPGGFDSIGDEENSHYALMRDSATGEVRGILRDWPDPTDSLAAGRRVPPEPGLEIVTSGGIPGVDSW